MKHARLDRIFNSADTGNHSYASPDMCVAEQQQAEAALERVSVRMARQTMRNMLHLDPRAADGFGGQQQLQAQLESAYRRSLRAPD